MPPSSTAFLRRARGLDPCAQCLSTLQRIGWPVLLGGVVLGHRGVAVGDHDPRLLRRCEDVDVGRQMIRLIERAYPHERVHRARAGIVTPYGDATARTARDLLALPARRRRV